MAKKISNTKQNLDTNLTEDAAVHDDLGQFAFDQMKALTDNLLRSKSLSLSQVMHVIHSFAYATEAAGCKQDFGFYRFESLLVQCGIEAITDYCQNDESHRLNKLP